MDLTTRALALKSIDYKEADKLVWLYSLEYGLVTVHAKGVRKSSAKLKYAVDQFCFGQYELTTSGDFYLLKNCNQIESFYGLREDVASFYTANVIAETLLNYAGEGQSDGQTFVVVLKMLEQLCLGTNPLTVALKYVLFFLKKQGLGLDFSHCSVCGSKTGKKFVDCTGGGVTCSECKSDDALPVPDSVVSVCVMTDGVSAEKLANLNFADQMLKDALNVCLRYARHFEMPLKSLQELIKL